MIFSEITEYCQEKPNGTYDLIPYVDVGARTVVFEWGNSLRISALFDKETAALQSVVGKVFKDVHPERIRELLMLPNVRVRGR